MGNTPPKTETAIPSTGGSSGDGGTKITYERERQNKLPTPKEIFTGLDEYVIGQSNVKMALSVGVHNHYKRIAVMDALEAERQRLEAAMLMQATAAGVAPNFNNDITMEGHNGISDLNLSQFGKAKGGKDFSAENNISKPHFARQVEECELDKSNIVIIGPTGSGKTLLVSKLCMK